MAAHEYFKLEGVHIPAQAAFLLQVISTMPFTGSPVNIMRDPWDGTSGGFCGSFDVLFHDTGS